VDKRRGGKEGLELAKRLANRGHEVHWYGKIGWRLNDDDSRTIKRESVIL
jgi:hypothetical protein